MKTPDAGTRGARANGTSLAAGLAALLALAGAGCTEGSRLEGDAGSRVDDGRGDAWADDGGNEARELVLNHDNRELSKESISWSDGIMHRTAVEKRMAARQSSQAGKPDLRTAGVPPAP